MPVTNFICATKEPNVYNATRGPDLGTILKPVLTTTPGSNNYGYIGTDGAFKDLFMTKAASNVGRLRLNYSEFVTGFRYYDGLFTIRDIRDLFALITDTPGNTIRLTLYGGNGGSGSYYGNFFKSNFDFREVISVMLIGGGGGGGTAGSGFGWSGGGGGGAGAFIWLWDLPTDNLAGSQFRGGGSGASGTDGYSSYIKLSDDTYYLIAEPGKAGEHGWSWDPGIGGAGGTVSGLNLSVSVNGATGGNAGSGGPNASASYTVWYGTTSWSALGGSCLAGNEGGGGGGAASPYGTGGSSPATTESGGNGSPGGYGGGGGGGTSNFFTAGSGGRGGEGLFVIYY